MKNQLRQWEDGLQHADFPDEYESKQLVRLYDINVPEGMRIFPDHDPDFSGIPAPYVIKVCSPMILHKTDLKGVALNVSATEARQVIHGMQERFPGDNILIEAMTAFQTPEFIIGVIRDPALGHAVMVGAGGILTEIYKDAAFRLVPCSVFQAMDMLDELTLSPVFRNFRGMGHDKKKLAQVVARVSRLADDMGDRLSQLDINPIVYADGAWVALDVKVMFE